MSDETIHAMNAGKDGTVTGYMCMIDWECEIGAAADGNRVYPSVAALKREHACWEDCGIVEVKVAFSRVMAPSRFEERITAEFAAKTPSPSP